MAKLLLIDDNEVNLDMLSRRLRLKGHTVVCATNGVEGIDQANRERPDLILMDMSMPHLNGWDATRQLRSAPLTRSVPIIAVTSHAMKQDQQRALEVGCSAFITKPVDLAKLESAIQRLVHPETL